MHFATVTVAAAAAVSATAALLMPYDTVQGVEGAPDAACGEALQGDGKDAVP